MDDLLHIDDLTRGKLVLGIPEERQRWRDFLKAVPAIGESLAVLVRDDHRPVRSRFLETLAIVASHLQQEQRLVLLFDPEKYLHADYAAEWLHIAQELPERVTAVFAQRPDDALIASNDLNAISNVHHIPARPLGSLSRSESDEFLRKFVNGNPALSHLGTPAKEPELNSLQAVFWERYQGYPLAMRIVADELDTDPVRPLETLRQLPSRLADLLQRQYNNVRDKVGADGLRLLKALAVQPFPVGFNVISSILSLDRNIIEQLSARRELRALLRIEANPALSLYHSIFEEFVQSKMDPVERKEYHNSSCAAYFNAHKANPNDNDLLVATAYHLEQSDLLTERPSEYAQLAHKIGNAFGQLPHVNRSANLANTIACYEAALRVYTERDFPAQWATIQNNLGVANAKLPAGDRSVNLKRAIAYYEAALRVRTERDFPVDWAMTQNNLGAAYATLPTGDRGVNLQQAIACYEAALRVYTERDFPAQWAMLQNNLGNAYGELSTGDRGANLAQAIACYEAALRGYKAAGFAEEVGRVTRLLALVKEQ
jgi:tetratricopeptide (TPR) repeat protein